MAINGGFYPAIQNSLEAQTTAQVLSTATTVPVDHCQYFIPVGWAYTDVSYANPVLAVINPENTDYTYPETVKIVGISAASGAGNLTVVRAIGGTVTAGYARTWASGTKIATILTAQHITQMQDALNNLGYVNGIGVQWDTTSSNPALSRVDRFGSTITPTLTDFNNSPIWGQMRRCNLADDGTVDAWYGDSDFAYDGSNGQVMVWIPAFYYIAEKANADGAIRWAVTPTPGTYLKRHPSAIVAGRYTPGFFWGAFEACAYDVSGATYNTTDAAGVDFTVGTGDKLSSIAGVKPISGENNDLTRAKSRILAENRGTGWQLTDFNQLSAIQMLFMIEAGTLNSQSLYEGVTDLPIGTGNESINTGYTAGVGSGSSDLGNASGEVSVLSTQPFSYRGIENLYGNIWKYADGINIKADRNPWIADNNFSDDIFTYPYVDTGLTIPSTNDYITDILFSTTYFDYTFLPSALGGSGSTYFCDTCFTDVGNKKLSYGGYWGGLDKDGLFRSNASDENNRFFGTRLAYVPQIGD